MNDDIDRATEETRAFLAAPQPPDLTAAVMGAIENLEPLAPPRRAGLLARIAASLWTPREVSLRPAFALAGGAMIAMLVLFASMRGGDPAVGTEQAGGMQGPHLFVQFRLDAAASRVQLAGSFTNWEPRYELRQAAPGIWTITVPLTQGVHDYAFVVDGQQWVADPYAPQIGDGFGGTNNRLALLSPDTPEL
jgi:hypothetical protein